MRSKRKASPIVGSQVEDTPRKHTKRSIKKTDIEKPREASSSKSQIPTPSTITQEHFTRCLAAYEDVVPSKLKDLDHQRYHVIPAAVAARATASARGKASARYLTKEELVTLVEWKLKHGTFRPALLGMAKQHTSESVEKTTTEAFAELDDPIAALEILITMRGIGPATASLLLSVAKPDEIPFFSDELYRWMMWDQPSNGKGIGWDRKIGYTNKEYANLAEEIQKFSRGDIGSLATTKALDVERVAYVLRNGKT